MLFFTRHFTLCSSPQVKHTKGRMITLSGKDINKMSDLIAHYKREADGLPDRLVVGSDNWDPPIRTPDVPYPNPLPLP